MDNRWAKRIAEDGLPVDFDNVLKAHQRLATLPYSAPAKLLGSRILSEQFDMDVYFLICTEATKSFKWRGAGNALLHAAEKAEGKEGVAASAGNHAQGFVLAAVELFRRGQLGPEAEITALTLVIPENTPPAKKDKIYANSKVVVDGKEIQVVNIIEHGESYDEAKAFAEKYISENTAQRISIPPYDYKYTIAGGGTLGIEGLALMNGAKPSQSTQFAQTSRMNRRNIVTPDILYVPSGGGGLVAGMAVVMDELAPNTVVVACEPSYVASKYAAMVAGHPVKVPAQPARIDGIRTATGISVAEMGELPCRIMQELRVRTQSVTHNQFSWTTNALNRNEWDRESILHGSKDPKLGINSEASGAAGVAAFLNMSEEERDFLRSMPSVERRKRPIIMCVITGANIDKEDIDMMHDWTVRNPDFPRDNTVSRYVPPPRTAQPSLWS